VSVFVDTLAIVALLDTQDQCRHTALSFWEDSVRREVPLFTTNYVLIETTAVVQRRLGLAALQTFRDDIVPFLDVVWVTEAQHTLGMNTALIAGRRKLSIVDCISFLIMQERRVNTAFTFDEHFREQGFTVVP
jgi:predicted nucleic acid-binding protein